MQGQAIEGLSLLTSNRYTDLLPVSSRSSIAPTQGQGRGRGQTTGRTPSGGGGSTGRTEGVGVTSGPEKVWRLSTGRKRRTPTVNRHPTQVRRPVREKRCPGVVKPVQVTEIEDSTLLIVLLLSGSIHVDPRPDPLPRKPTLTLSRGTHFGGERTSSPPGSGLSGT